MAIEAEARCAAVEYGLRLIHAGWPVGKAWEAAANRIGASVASLHRWYQRVRGQPRHEWTVHLGDRYVGRTHGEIPPAAWDFFCQAYEATSPPSIKAAYRAVAQEASRRGWKLPSERTFHRRLEPCGMVRNRYGETPL